MWYKALITGDSNPKHALSTHQFKFEKMSTCSRNQKKSKKSAYLRPYPCFKRVKVVICCKINFLKRLIWVEPHWKVTSSILYKHTNFYTNFFRIFEKSIYLFLVVLRGHNLRFNEAKILDL